MNDHEHPEGESRDNVPPGTCPLCGSSIRNPSAEKFECPNCHRLIQSSKASRILHRVVCLGLATGICWLSGQPWLVKVAAWPVLAFILGVLYYTLAAFVWIPTYQEFRPRAKDDVPFQKLNLDK